MVFGLTRFHMYTYGRHVYVHNDHKPLIGVFKKAVEDNPIHLQKMLVRLMTYDFEFVYVKGKELFLADALADQAPLIRKEVTWRNPLKK